MMDLMTQISGWLAVAMMWAFLPVAAYATWRQFHRQVQSRIQARQRVIRFERKSRPFEGLALVRAEQLAA